MTPPTYDELLSKIVELTDELEISRGETARARKSSDDNYNAGQGWKKQADQLASTIDKALNERTMAQTEAAELRGYIRRVNELDPKRVRQQQRVEHTGPSQHELERMMRR